eukprot:TRINITY_DN15184_c0_g2_i5.p1 TRINITY_DN15184_c0_g2~~TRINITY_DN15184_c0_g2_i5.p1  ORF type:complete len:752 (-),score=190.90 TRINITY_DN15184_c0_g2_i5:44-2299(-)
MYRKDKHTHTPRRNPQVETVSHQLRDLAAWCSQVADVFHEFTQLKTVGSEPVSTAQMDTSVFVPVVPVLESSQQSAPQPAETGLILPVAQRSTSADSPLLRSDDINLLLDEERKALARRAEQATQVYVDTNAVATSVEITVWITVMHMQEVCASYEQCIGYIESLIRDQLVAAIGKVLTPDDFAEYIHFHNSKLFAAPYAPRPFAYAVRRSPQHSPQGMVAIEHKPEHTDAILRPIYSLVKHSPAQCPMKVQLSASVQIAFTGDRFVHGVLLHKFSSQPCPKIAFVARARQFSSFIVLLGRISGPQSFDPTHGMLVRNKDEFLLPLEMETIPTPKEFKEAVSSLSPEQQAFCKAFRGMQLESTLFGVVVIQIQPQLERLLNLAPDSLAKEIQLQERLMELFVKYQIPADLLAFEEGAEPVPLKDPRRVQAVKASVAQIYETIDQEKDREAAEKLQQAEYSRGQAPSSPSSGRRRKNVSEIQAELDQVKEVMLRNIENVISRGESLDCLMEQSEDLAAASKSFMEASNKFKVSNDVVSSTSRGQSSRTTKNTKKCEEEDEPAEPKPKSAPDPKPATNMSLSSQQASTTKSLIEHAEDADYTQLPRHLEKQLEQLDADAAVRPTIIKTGDAWTHRSQQGLLATTKTKSLSADDQKDAKNVAFDLLDGLTRGGALGCEHASMHVVLAATHCFDQNLMDTLVQQSMNPIEKVECSTLIMASSIHRASVHQLVQPEQLNDIRGEALRIDGAPSETV